MTVLGIDVSTWQGVMNWPKAKSAGAKFAFIRAGSINNITQEIYTDYQYHTNAVNAKDQMLGLGAYWYFRPQFKVADQANYFASLISQYMYNMPPVADVEFANDLNPEQMANALENFLSILIQKVGTYPIIYTRATFFNPSVESRDWDVYDLWIARYTTLPKPWGNPGDYPTVEPRDWENWAFWQYSADGNGKGAEFGAQSGSMDMDYFYGDEATFNAYIKSTDPLPTRVMVTAANGTVIRAAPGAGLMLRIEPCGACLGVTNYGEDNTDQLWYAVGDGYVKASNVKSV